MHGGFSRAEMHAMTDRPEPGPDIIGQMLLHIRSVIDAVS